MDGIGIDPEDYKLMRKLRKNLKQIEHLQLLNRELNPEEKFKVIIFLKKFSFLFSLISSFKVSKRVAFRQELQELNEKYPQILIESENTTFENSENSSFEEPLNNCILNKSLNIESITEKFCNLNIAEQKPQTTKINEPAKVAEVKHNEQQKPVQFINTNKIEKAAETKKQIKEEIFIETNKTVKKQLSQQLVKFTAIEVENAHEDLITCLDISSDTLKLVTGGLVLNCQK